MTVSNFMSKAFFYQHLCRGGHYVPVVPPNRGMIRQKYPGADPGADGYSLIYLVIPLKPSLIEISHESHFVISFLNHCSIAGTYLSLRIIYVFKSLDFLSFSHHCNFHEMIKPILASFVHFWFRIIHIWQNMHLKSILGRNDMTSLQGRRHNFESEGA